MAGKPLPDFLRDLKIDKGRGHLGKDGIIRILTTDNTVIDAKALDPAQIQRVIECVPTNLDLERPDMAGIDGTKVPDEQLLHPPDGILPPVLTEEERRERRRIIEAKQKEYRESKKAK